MSSAACLILALLCRQAFSYSFTVPSPDQAGPPPSFHPRTGSALLVGWINIYPILATCRDSLKRCVSRARHAFRGIPEFDVDLKPFTYSFTTLSQSKFVQGPFANGSVLAEKN
jgi:hypothetical protein